MRRNFFKAAGGVLVFSDDFNRSNRLLNGDNGWIGDANGIGIVGLETGRFSGVDSSLVYQDFGLTNFQIQCELKTGIDGSNFGGLLFRGDGLLTSLSFWRVLVLPGTMFLQSIISGSVGVTLTSPFVSTAGVFTHVDIVDNGSDITVICTQGANSSSINTTDLANSGNTHVGLRITGAGDIGHDNFDLFSP